MCVKYCKIREMRIKQILLEREMIPDLFFFILVMLSKCLVNKSMGTVQTWVPRLREGSDRPNA